jgi:sugar phosphate isomerase/epimerase
MELLVATASLPYYPLSHGLTLARQLGADGVELALTPRLLHQGPDRARRLADEHAIPIRSVVLASGQAPADPEGIAEVGRFLAALPACRLLVLPAPRATGASGSGRQGGLGAYVGVLQQYLNALDGGDVALTIENAGPAAPGGPSGPLDRFPQLRRLVEEWDLAYTFDTSHAAAHGWVITEPLPLMGGRLRNVHLSDYRLPPLADRPPEPPSRYLHQLPGDGILPLRAFLRVLCRRGYAGLVTLDLHPRALGAWWPPAARRNLAAALAYCRTVLRDCTPSPPLHLERRGEASEAPAEAENEG